jgi:hypothetical protein
MRDFAVETGDNKAERATVGSSDTPLTTPHSDRSRGGMADDKSIASPAPEVYEVRYPFVRDVYQAVDGDSEGFGYVKVPTWKPGVRNEDVYPDDCIAVADGVGLMRLTVVSRHRPSPKYRERVFFTREFVDPDGRTFGKKQLRMLGAQAFKRIATSFRVEYEMAKSKEGAA